MRLIIRWNDLSLDKVALKATILDPRYISPHFVPVNLMESLIQELLAELSIDYIPVSNQDNSPNKVPWQSLLGIWRVQETTPQTEMGYWTLYI